MTLKFQHVSLEHSITVYNNMTISVRKGEDTYWRIYVNGNLANKGPFLTRRFAVECLEKTIAKIEGTTAPSFMQEVSSLLNKPKPRRACPTCGSTRFPHKCAGPTKDLRLKPGSPIRRMN